MQLSTEPLYSLIISGCHRVSDAGLVYLSASLSAQTLHTLNISLCGSITDIGLTHLSALSRQRSLNMAGAKVCRTLVLAHQSNLSLHTVVMDQSQRIIYTPV